MLTPIIAASLASAVAHGDSASNMNGRYTLSRTPDAGDTEKLFPSSYSDYPGGAEYFDVYSPLIRSVYSEVFWTPLDPVPLPAAIVQRFKNKSMAIIGFETDQVRQTPEGDVRVPINVAYNHHFEATITGAKSHVEKIRLHSSNDPRSRDPATGHLRPVDEEGRTQVVVELAPSTSGVPTHAATGAANGGEYRKSFHGFAPGYALGVDSPDTWHITPMQIDTWNRDKMSVRGGPFVPGPLPRNALSPGSPRVPAKSAADILYSGLLECPVTTRIVKHVYGGYRPVVAGASGCNAPPAEAEGPAPADLAACETAAKNMIGALCSSVSSRANHTDRMPPGCSIVVPAVDGPAAKAPTCTAVFNTLASSTAPCGGGATASSGGATWGDAQGAGVVTIGVSIDVKTGLVELSLRGPAERWFGVGFNASTMGGGAPGAPTGPYAIIVGGGALLNVTERRLANHAPGEPLAPMLTVLSHTVVDGERRLVVRRELKGATPAHYSFDMARDSSLRYISAIGGGATFGRDHHQLKTSDTMLLVPRTVASCVCAAPPAPFGSATGSLEYIDPVSNTSKGRVGFNNKCAPQPRMDTLEQHNPTCDLRTYAGGQIACHHGWMLLDADQDVPWPNVTLEYRLKFRYWFQEYNPAVHTLVHRTTWGIASPVEYDVPPCAAGTPTSECVHTISGLGVFAPAVPGQPIQKLAAAHFHCHAPTCLSIALYRCDPHVHTECANRTLLCEERPLYGGHDERIEDPFAEPGYIAQPPCLWGRAEHGLAPPPTVSGANLYAVAKTNSTYGHHGEMAWLQVLLIDADSDGIE